MFRCYRDRRWRYRQLHYCEKITAIFRSTGNRQKYTAKQDEMLHRRFRSNCFIVPFTIRISVDFSKLSPKTTIVHKTRLPSAGGLSDRLTGKKIDILGATQDLILVLIFWNFLFHWVVKTGPYSTGLSTEM